MTSTPTAYFAYSYTLGGTYGTAPGQFEAPQQVAVSNNGSVTLVYVTDGSNNRVQVYNSSTSSWTTYGGTASGTNPGQFYGPSGIGVDGSGDIFVADRNNYRIQEYNGSSWSVISLGSGSATAGYFGTPSGVSVDGSGKVYVFDGSNAEVQTYSSATWGILTSGYPGPEGSNAGVNAAGTTVYASDIGTNYIYRYASGSWTTFKSGTGPGNGTFASGIYDVKVDGQGNVFAADFGNKLVQEFDPNGNFLTQFGGSGTLSGPAGLALDGYGNVYVVDGNGIVVFSYVP